jgi:hypothetical protein
MSTNLKYILITLTVLVFGAVAMIIYRMFFQFNEKEIHTYIMEESAKYGKDSAAVASIIAEGVEYILSSHNLTQQVLRSARGSNTDPEQELVNAAINQCIAFNYLKRP